MSRKSFPAVKNDLLLRVCREEGPVAETPVWMMRQAGRYLPEFKALRAENEFVKVCKDAHLASEVTVQPWRRFASGELCEVARSLPWAEVTAENALDAVIVFSDILTIPAALGQTLTMVPGKGPVLTPAGDAFRQVSPEDVSRFVEDELGYVFDAVFASRMKIHSAVPVIGFSGAPFTLFSYMVEGGGSKTWAAARAAFYRRIREDPHFLKPIESVVAQYLIGQYDAGADMLQLFETNADELPAEVYSEFVVPGLRRIVAQVKQSRPEAIVALFAKDYRRLEDLADFPDVLGVGWKDDIATVLAKIKARGLSKVPVLQGNLDPAVLLSGDLEILHKVKELKIKMKNEKWIANLGHGMMPEMNPSMAKTFLQAVKSSL
jgi:uroporphyrinogen decarboxylase